MRASWSLKAQFWWLMDGIKDSRDDPDMGRMTGGSLDRHTRLSGEKDEVYRSCDPFAAFRTKSMISNSMLSKPCVRATN